MDTEAPPIGPEPGPRPSEAWLSPARLGPPWAYAAATAITVGMILSQYVVPESFPALAPLYQSVAGAVLLVYVVPVLAFLFLVGLGPLRNWRQAMGTAAVHGVAWYGMLSLVALFIGVVLIAVFAEIDPGALGALSRPNPDLTAAASNPWFYVVFSFAVGAFEETIFRGWIFGYWLARGTPRWFFHAVWTSLLFASVHLYYGTTYGVAASVLFPTLFLTGLAFAITVRNSRGNLVMVSFLHGWNDATAFLMLVSAGASLLLHYGMILVGVVLFVALWIRSGDSSPRFARPARESTLATDVEDPTSELSAPSGGPEPTGPKRGP